MKKNVILGNGRYYDVRPKNHKLKEKMMKLLSQATKLCVIFATIAGALLTSCSPKISDSDISEQVSSYLKQDERDGGFSQVAFSQFFEIQKVVVKDKLIKEKECVTICNITMKVIRPYQGGSGVNMAYSFLVGDGPGSAGDVRAIDVKFLFEKFESGWRIKGKAD
jgi:hypothetical protein